MDIFLFLSGFGLYYSYNNSTDVFMFYRKRFKRILPIWFLTAVPWYLYIDFFKSNSGLKLFLGDVSTLSFLSNGDRGHWYIFGIVVLYLIYPVWHEEIHNNTIKTMLVFSSVWIILIIYIAFFKPFLFENINVFLMRIPIFFIGAFFVTLSECEINISVKKVTLVLFILFILSLLVEGLLCIFGMQYSALARLFYTPFALAICYFCPLLHFNNLIYFIVEWLGKISLEVYLVHMKIISIVSNVLPEINLAIVNVLSVFITLLFCFLLKNISELIITSRIWRK